MARVSPLELGPPVGWPLQYRITGPDKDEVRKYSEQFAELLGSDPRVRHVHYDWMEPARQVRIHVDQDEARRLGVSSRSLAAALNASVTGSPVTQLRDDIYLVNVIARATDDQRASFETMSSLQVPTPSGRTVPLRQFATFTEEQEFPLVWRRNRVPTLTVRADVIAGALPDSVVGALAPKVAEFGAKLPPHYKVETGGMYEESAESSASVFAVVPLMILLMLAAMMLLLVSFRRLAMVVALLPLGLIGVVLTLLAFNRPLGFVAILGILALIGMIAKNAVILIVSIEEERAAGKSVADAVMTACTGRLRPMILTAISTVLGLIPIAPTVFWGPMAFAIMGGLLVATLLTLILLPVLYVMVFGNEKTVAATLPPCPPDPAARAERCRTDDSSARRRGPTRVTGNRAVLELQVGEMRQLFNAMDPAPFRERDLDPQAVTYIVDWGRETPARHGRSASPCASRAKPRQRNMRACCATRFDAYFRQRAGGHAAAVAAAVSRRARQPADRPRVPGAARSMLGELVAGLDQQGELQLAHQGKLRDRRMGRAVAAARDLPLRLVADPRGGAAAGPPGRNGRARRRHAAAARGAAT